MQKTLTLAVMSGKGGVGKTNITLNTALALTRLGERVLVIDGDLGLANIDVLLGVTPAHSLQDVLTGDLAPEDAITEALRENEQGRGFVIECTIDADEMVHPMVNGGHHITEFLLN